MEIKINMSLPKEIEFELCSYCFGTGNLKAMQMAMRYNAEPIRVQDKLLKCPVKMS